MVNFIQDNLSCKVKLSKQLISHDEKNATANEKHTTLVELAPVCREDLVILPKSLSKEMGGIGPLVLVYKISKFVHIVDIHSMQTFEVDQILYWKNPFKALLTRDRLTEFVVLDIEGMDTNMNDSRAALKQKFKLVKIQVCRHDDYSTTFWVNCHLGHLLDYNDSVLGYDLERMNLVELDDLKEKSNFPEVIIVKKYHKSKGNRKWKLKRIKQVESQPEEETVKGKKPKKSHQVKALERQQNADDKDYEQFLIDLEEDPEYRQSALDQEDHTKLKDTEDLKKDNSQKVEEQKHPKNAKKDDDDGWETTRD